MNILSQLSSQRRDRTEASNRKVGIQCIDDPLLLDEIAAGLQSGNPALMGDCAEVFTEVALDHPALVAPYGPKLAKLITHPHTKVRWEAMHALALIATRIPEVIQPLLSQIARCVEEDGSVIVRDYAVKILSGHAAASPQAAREVYPYLTAALTLWDGKHAGHALPGLAQVACTSPDFKAEIQAAIEPLLNSPKGVVRNAARKTLKAIT